MKPEALNSWLTLGANVGVLIGLGLLLLELDQNATAVKAQTRNDLSMGIVQILSDVYSDSELSSIMRRADGGEDLTIEETFRYELRSRTIFRYWENVHYQYRQGLYDEIEYLAQKDAWQDYFTDSKRLTPTWCSMRIVFSPIFISEIDAIIDKAECTSNDA